MKDELSPRLEGVISLIRHGVVVADIGCDHALVSAELLRRGIVKKAILSDIRPGPVARARENVSRYCESCGLSSEAFVILLGDGLSEACRYAPDDVVIAGMGGEMIAKILDDSEYAKSEGVSLILQPMSSIPELRSYLASEGYEIETERRIREDDKFYEIILCHYNGHSYELDEVALECGMSDKILKCDIPTYRMQLADKIKRLKKIAAQKAASGVDNEHELYIIGELSRKL